MITLYPTDTLYGLGVRATDSQAILRLKELKGSDETKHFSIVVFDIEMMREYAEVTPLAQKLIKKFLPGKLTLILCAKPRLRTSGIVAEDGSIGVRIPDHPVPLELVKKLGVPITATSANVSGMKTEKTVDKILKQFGERASWIDEVIDGGELSASEPSAVVDARGDTPIIIREGAISKEEIEELL